MDYFTCKTKVNAIIKDYLTNSEHDQRFKDGMRYILANGKRLRSVLTLAVLEKLLPEGWEAYKQICLVPEFIHTSSLIIDDLPAFDNAKNRREQKCIHLEFGEGLAYLLSFNLVTEAVLIIHKQLPCLKKIYPAEQAYQHYEAQIYNLMTNISANKAIGGQLLSTFNFAGNTNIRHLKGEQQKLEQNAITDILVKKTGSFFEIALVTGWIFGRGDINKLASVQELANLIGLCYQIYDDFVDYDEDHLNHSHNYVYHRGVDVAYTEYQAYKQEMLNRITVLQLNCPVFDYMIKFIDNNIEEHYNTLKFR